MLENLEFSRVMNELTVYAAQWGLKVLGGLTILVIGYVIAGWVSRRVREAEHTSLDPTVLPTLAKIVRLLILTLTAVTVLSVFEIPVASLLAVLGAAGLAIGLALQGTLSNVAAGLILLTLRPFEAGDTVEVGGSRLVVDEIGLIMTKLHTVDNVFVALPNSQVWGREIRNYSRNSTRRLDLVVGISYQDDIDKAMALVQRELESDERILEDPPPLVGVAELGESSVNLLVRPWVNTADYFALQRDLQKRIKQRFDQDGVSIPFPQRDVHLHQA